MDVGIVDNRGEWWGGTTRVVFQYRSSRYSAWRDLDFGYASGRSFATVQAMYQGDGYYRVWAPDLGLAEEKSYA
jgi:hypothetical protein